jgi:hypothetical protein
MSRRVEDGDRPRATPRAARPGDQREAVEDLDWELALR